MSGLARAAGPVVALLAAGAAVAVGCTSTTTTATSGTSSSRVEAGSTATVTSTTDAPPATRGPGESEGGFVFRTQCAGCHGVRGEGNLGPALVGIADRMTEADEVARVRAGAGRMPPFSPALSDAEIAAVVAHTRAELR